MLLLNPNFVIALSNESEITLTLFPFLFRKTKSPLVWLVLALFWNIFFTTVFINTCREISFFGSSTVMISWTKSISAQ